MAEADWMSSSCSPKLPWESLGSFVHVPLLVLGAVQGPSHSVLQVSAQPQALTCCCVPIALWVLLTSHLLRAWRGQLPGVGVGGQMEPRS